MTVWKFSAEKMLIRLKEEGKESLVTEKISTILDKIDKKPITRNRWQEQVNGIEAYYVQVGAEQYPVNIEDCYREDGL